MSDRFDSPNGRTHFVGDDCQPAHEPLASEPWEGPLTAEEQGMIDAAWETHRAAGPRTLLDGFGEATDQVVTLRAENARLRAELQAREAVVEVMRATLTDFADPDHWTQNDDGEWIWYGTYPPFERPTLDLVGPLAPSVQPPTKPWYCPHQEHSTGECNQWCECQERIRNGTYGMAALDAVPRRDGTEEMA